MTTLTAPCDGDATVIAPGVEITDIDVVGMTIRVLKKGNYSQCRSLNAISRRGFRRELTRIAAHLEFDGPREAALWPARW